MPLLQPRVYCRSIHDSCLLCHEEDRGVYEVYEAVGCVRAQVLIYSNGRTRCGPEDHCVLAAVEQQRTAVSI